MTTLTDQTRAWIDDDVDDASAAELRALLDAGPAGTDELAERFAGSLTFGTAGLRGPMRAGPNGMNRTVVRRTAAGISTWLRDRGDTGRVVVVGYDGRRDSCRFAHDTAAIFAAAGFSAQLLPRQLPTPLLAYAVQQLDAVAGIMITASHNPPQDNGIKVYGSGGSQIISPADGEIEAAIQTTGPTRAIPLDPTKVTLLDDALIDGYITAAVGMLRPGPRNVRIVHTAMHGVGTEVATRVFADAGFPALIEVPEQAQPDPAFPTVAFPNPEEPGALDLAVNLARHERADLLIANDPDADRCAVAVPVDPTAPGHQWRMLRGDEVGVLLADSLLRKGIRGTYATTIVSSSQMRAIAGAAKANYAETLTGFKWIVRAAPDLAYGYEEALGYAVAPWLVNDKDGITAALRIAEYAAELAAAGSSLLRRLEELAQRHGRHQTDQISIRVNDLALIDTMMVRLRTDPPSRLLDKPVTVDDLLPNADVLRWTVSGGRVIIRPSGTEPKLKAYLEVVEFDSSSEHAQAQLTRLRTEVGNLLSG